MRKFRAAAADYARVTYIPSHIRVLWVHFEEPDPPVQEPAPLSPYGEFLISRGAKDTLLYGLPWGLQARLDGPPVKRKGTVLDTHLIWMPGQEAAAAKHVRDRVMEGLLEVAYVTLQRLNFEKLLYGNARAPRDTQGAEAFNREVLRKMTTINSGIRDAATAALQMEKDLKRRFDAAGDNFTKTLEVCGRYLEGKMGVDWFVADFFPAIPRPIDDGALHRRTGYDVGTRAGHSVYVPIGLFGINYEDIYAKQEQRMLEQQLAMEKHLKGNPHQHFGNRNLKPLMKQYPQLARLYGVEAS